MTRIMLISLMFLSGCSLTLDFDECEADGDCAARAGAGPALVCSPEGFCVEGAAEPEPEGQPEGQPEGEPEGEPEPEGCCTTTGCIAEQGQNFICNGQCQCVQALSEECFAVAGPIEQDDTFIIGSILPTRGANASKGVPREQAIQLAVNEINQNGGLGNGRRLVHIGCDDDGKADQGKVAAAHLVDVVGVSAIVGPAFSGVFTDVSDQVTSRKGVFIMSPSATSASITTLDDDNLSWRAAPSDAFQGGAAADRIRDLRALQGGQMRLAALAKDDAYGSGLLNRIIDELGVELGEDNFVGRIYAPAGDLATPVIGLIEEFGQADVVLLFGTNETVTLIDNYESFSEQQGLRPPNYILSDGGQSAELLTFAAAHPELAGRLEGVAPDGKNGGLFTAFAFRFRNRYGVEPGSFTANAYDATFLVAYAAMSLGSGAEITGAGLAAAMAKVVTGQTINAGPTDVGTARNTLLSGNPINYEGASGPLQFDLTTGDVSANISLWHVVPDGDDFEFEDVMLYRIDDDGLGGVWGPPDEE